MEYRAVTIGLFGLDVCGPDHLAPFLGFIRDELTEVGRRTRKHRTSQVGDPCLHPRIGKSRVDLPVEPG